MPKPLLCVTVTAATTVELCARRDAVQDADLIELRLDSVADPSAAAALKGRRRPVIVTCRPTWEGGAFRGSEEERKQILTEALALGAEFVDIEWSAGFDDLIAARSGRGIIVSKHTFDGMPANLAGDVAAMRATGAEVVKVAATPSCLADTLRLRAAGCAAAASGTMVVVGMGDYGIASRVLPSHFGSAWTYAGSLRSIGQISASTLLNEFRFRTHSDQTALYGLAARATGYSLSPVMHNAAFAAGGYDAVYVPLPATSADDFVAFAHTMGLRGASITIPYKVALLDAIDDVDPSARRIGAINTIRVGDDGRWTGANTDVSGFLAPLKDVPLAGMRASVLGAGGAARAVAVALSSTGASVCIHARRREEADRIAAVVDAAVGPWPPACGSWDLLVNCTPVGMYPHPDESPVPADRLTGRYVYDLIYKPMQTRLLRDAASAGCATIGGLDMLVAQAEAQFLWWTGTAAVDGVMRAAALKKVAEWTRDEDHVV